jgi:predicted Rossmann fold nucleotide-binding protein DprA/Smf involved in DNA uptake
MGRNKLIHGFGKYTVVVRSGDKTGGTWEGSTENIEHSWSPLLVCSHNDTPLGNESLIEKGGIPIDPTDIPEKDSLDEWVHSRQQNISDLAGHKDKPTIATDKPDTSDDPQSSLNDFN